MIPLPVDAFRSALLEATRQAWEELKQRLPGERIYGFSLGLHALGSRVGPAFAQSEEGLTRAALESVQRGYSARTGDALKLLRANNRWYASEGWIESEESYFRKAGDLLEVRFGSAWEEFVDNGTTGVVFETCRQVLRTMDAEADFGTGIDRELLTLNLYLGDQSDEQLIGWAKEVNTPENALRFAAELATGHVAYKQIRSPYDKD